MYSKGNYTQYSMINHNENMKKRITYKPKSLCYTAKINMALQINYTSIHFLNLQKKFNLQNQFP